MPFKKGEIANPNGIWSSKPFREALRLEINSAGTNHKALRKIAAALLKEAEAGNINAIIAVADRLDGKPAQETTNINLNVYEQMNEDELIARIRLLDAIVGSLVGAPGVRPANGSALPPPGKTIPH